ncbi:alpha/beta hydrolase [Halomonas aquamarina]|uniref:Alpha/beta hydrolase n=1 Tax=Vreelandella aquamarina TaxID=77097 RepID=A0ACC5VR31_9GAMM|nr:alpha/beta hydrolase-fold protein [Halomonas aquamarina]MBZ5486593.1 alpha/beta hydrolase [Halomonas aquamarina]
MAYSASPGDVTLPGTAQFLLTASEPEREYLIQVSVPDAPPPDAGYPVLYLLDGNARLPLLQAARDTLTRQGPDGMGNPLLIVAIGYPDTERFSRERRSEDFTPDISADGDHSRGAFGGAERFLEFIQTHLKPVIEQRFAVDSDQEAILGHSYGGLFVLHALLTRPSSFDTYIAISPSLWWYGDKPLDRLASRYAVSSALPDARLMLGVGEDEQPGHDQPDTSERVSRQRARAMVDNTRAFAEWFGARQDASVSLTVFPGENHGSVMWPATRQALEFLNEPSQ